MADNPFKKLFTSGSRPGTLSASFVGDTPSYSLLSEDLSDGGDSMLDLGFGAGGPISEASPAENSAQNWNRLAGSFQGTMDHILSGSEGFGGFMNLYNEVLGSGLSGSPSGGFLSNPDSQWGINDVSINGISENPSLRPWEYKPGEFASPGRRTGGGTSTAQIAQQPANGSASPEYKSQLIGLFGEELGGQIAENPRLYDSQGKLRTQPANSATGQSQGSPTVFPSMGPGSYAQRKVYYDRTEGAPFMYTDQNGNQHTRIDARPKRSKFETTSPISL